MTNLYKAGDFFGYIPLLKNSDHTESAIVLEDSKICKISKEDFISLLYKNKDVAEKFIGMLSGNIVEKELQLLSLAYNTVRKRVAEALLTLETHYHEDGEKKFHIMVNRDDLASMAGTATESVVRALGEFKADKLIEVHGRTIILLNPEALKKIH